MSWNADLEILEGQEGYTYTGTAKGLSSNMQSYNLEIDVPLARVDNCTNTFATGSCFIKSGEEEEVILDFNPYNQGECDRVARAMVKRFEKIFYVY